MLRQSLVKSMDHFERDTEPGTSPIRTEYNRLYNVRVYNECSSKNSRNQSYLDQVPPDKLNNIQPGQRRYFGP